MIPDKDAYIYLYQEQFYTFFYIKLTRELLQTTLSIYIEDDEKPYLSVFFGPDGRDYLGRLSCEEICKLIEDCPMKNILTTEYDDLIKFYPSLSRETYNMCRDLCKTQLDNYC